MGAGRHGSEPTWRRASKVSDGAPAPRGAGHDPPAGRRVATGTSRSSSSPCSNRTKLCTRLRNRCSRFRRSHHRRFRLRFRLRLRLGVPECRSAAAVRRCRPCTCGSNTEERRCRRRRGTGRTLPRAGRTRSPLAGRSSRCSSRTDLCTRRGPRRTRGRRGRRLRRWGPSRSLSRRGSSRSRR